MIYVANAGNCRAVVSEYYKAIELSTDHKPNLESEKKKLKKQVHMFRMERLITI